MTVEQLEDEASAKIDQLKAQAKQGNADNKAKIEKRVEEVRANYKTRVAKLSQAGSLIKEALAA